MRVFVAINPGPEERARLGTASQKLRESGFPIRWVPPENVHLTLKFLGEVPEDHVPELCAAVGDAVSGVGEFEMAVQGFGAFPSLKRPSVVWAGIVVDASLERLQAGIEGALSSLGYPREERAFRPHLTLGRARRRAAASEFKGLDRIVEQLSYEDVFRVSAIDVMRSRLMPTGAMYDVVESARLEPRSSGDAHA